MAYTDLTLPSVVTPAGTISVVVRTDLGSLTVPTSQTITNIGDRVETAFGMEGFIEVASMNFSIQDDTSTYSQGFWYKVLASDCQVKFSIGSDLFFWGIIDNLQVKWSEFFVGSSYVRTAEITMPSIMQALLEVTTTDWEDEVVSHGQSATGASSDGKYIRYESLFTCMLHLAGINSSYTEDNYTYHNFVYDSSNPDIKWANSGATVFGYEKLFVCTHAADGITKNDVLDSSSGNGIHNACPTLKEVIPMLLYNIGCHARIHYNTTYSEYRFQFFTLGRTQALDNTFGGIIESNIVNTSKYMVDAVRFKDRYQPTIKWAWYSANWNPTGPSTATVPNYVEFGIDRLISFLSGTTESFATAWCFYVGTPNAGGASTATFKASDGTGHLHTADVWNYSTGAYYTNGNDDNTLCRGLAWYYFNRFNKNLRLITRKYNGMSSTYNSVTSHLNLLPLMRTSIDDGNGAAYYVANRVISNPSEDTVTVEWIQE